MPSITIPTGRVQPGRPARTYVVRRARDLLNTWGFVLAIYGPPGAGKTSLAVQAADSPYGKPTGVLDIEGGARAYANRDDVYHVQVQTWAEVTAATDDLIAGKLTPDESDGEKWGTLVLDNMSELNRACMAHVLRTVNRNVSMDDRPDQKDWNTTTSMMLTYIRRWRDFAQNSGTNVIFIAWDKQQDDKVTGIPKKDLAFNPALANEVPGLLDMVAYLTINKAGVRKLSFEASPTTAAKFRRTPGEPAMTIPGEFVYEFTSPHKPMVDLLACLKGGQDFPAGRYNTQAPKIGVRTSPALAAEVPTPGQSPDDRVRGVIMGEGVN